MSENINNLAFTFFSGLVICSILSDSYIIINNILNNNYIKKKISYCKKIYKIIIGLSFNSYKRDEEGNIIIEDIYNEKKINNKCTNPFDDDYIEENLEDLLEELNKNKEELEKIDPLIQNGNQVENKIEDENIIEDKNIIEEENKIEIEEKNLIIDLKSIDSLILNKENIITISNSNELDVNDNLIFKEEEKSIKEQNINEFNSKDIQIYNEEVKLEKEFNHNDNNSKIYNEEEKSGKEPNNNDNNCINNINHKEELILVGDPNLNEFKSKDIQIYKENQNSLLPETNTNNVFIYKEIENKENIKNIETNNFKFVDLSQSKKIGEKIITKKSKSKKNIEEIIKKKSKN